MAHTKEEIEAAERIASSLYPQENAPDSEDDILYKSYGTNCFLAGIDYQKSQSYSKEDLRKAFEAGENHKAELLKRFDNPTMKPFAYPNFDQWHDEEYPDQKQPSTDQPSEK